MEAVPMTNVAPTVSRGVPTSPGPNCRSLHRLKQLREEQGMSQANVARLLGVELASVNYQEQETTDLLLSELYHWQEALEVPVDELLLETASPLSRPVMERARMVRLMKTAAAICESVESESIRRLAERMITQLVEIMPELENVGAWHSVGQRRSMDEYGRVVERCLPEDLLFRTNWED